MVSTPEQRKEWREKQTAKGLCIRCADGVVMPGTKVCVRCAKKKNDYQKARYDASYHREGQLRRKYGLTIAQYDAMLDAQGGGCAICGGPPQRDRHDVDHDHDTGKVRGLLCQNCNLAIGGMGDDPSRLRKAAEYLEMNR